MEMGTHRATAGATDGGTGGTWSELLKRVPQVESDWGHAALSRWLGVFLRQALYSASGSHPGPFA